MSSTRPHRARTQWVVWLCVAVWLALVPLRSWAQVTMPWAQPTSSTQASAMPCHEAAVPGATDATDAAEASDAQAPPAPASHSLCTDCALCHAVAAPAPNWCAAAPHRPATHWQLPSSLPLVGRAAETPFKPPRA